MKKYNGLSNLEVQKNQSIYGLNQIKEVKKPNFFIVFFNEFKDWLVIILIIAAVLSLIVDPNSLIEVVIIIGILLLNASKSFILGPSIHFPFTAVSSPESMAK